MNNNNSYLNFKKGAGWTPRGAITPMAQEDYKTESYRWRQLGHLQLPQLGKVFKPLVTFKPFKWSRDKRASK